MTVTYRVIFRCPACSTNVDEVELEKASFLEYKELHSKAAKHHIGDTGDSCKVVVDTVECPVCNDP